MSYFIKYLPAPHVKIKIARHVFYKGEAYRHLSMLNNKDPNLYTFIKKDDDTRGYHEKWTDLEPVELIVYTDEVQVGDIDIYVEPQAVEGWEKGLRFELMSVNNLDGYLSANIKYLANPVKPDSVGNIREWPYSNLWKVVGKVSHDDEWVKVGMVFEKGDLFQHGLGINIHPDPNSIINFKCPLCKKFHL